MTVRAPAPRPCESCPYRSDVPAGVWHDTEYSKLPDYDQPTPLQPPNVFLCHQQNGRVCGGWAAVHDMDHALGLRLAGAAGVMTADEIAATRAYTTDAPLFASGAEAAAHGLSDRWPGADARRILDKLQRRTV